MLEQGCNYIDDPILSIAEFFEIRIENLEKSILPRDSPFHSPRDRNRRILRKGKSPCTKVQ